MDNRWQDLMLQTLHRINEGIIITDDKERILAVNHAVTVITGYEEPEMIGKTPRLFSSGAQDRAFYESMWLKIQRDGYWQGEILNRNKSGTTYPEWITINAIRDEYGNITNFVGVFIDISERKLWEKELEFQANHDSLTHLPNRRLLDLHLRQAIARAKRQETALVIGMLDLDDFKPINDTYGHKAGDQLLQQLCDRLQASIREEDFLARLGGDEFVLVFEALEPHRLAQSLPQILGRLHQVIEQPFTVGDAHTVEVGMSMGISVFPADGEDGDSLLRQADARLYKIKGQKSLRDSWWEGDADLHPAKEEETLGDFLDPYGKESKEQLEKSQQWLLHTADTFAVQFYLRMTKDHSFAQVISWWSPEAQMAFKEMLKRHILMLFDPSTEASHIVEEAKQIGVDFVLMGINSLMLVQMSTWYRQWFIERLNEISMRANERYRFSLLTDMRLQEDLQAFLQVENETSNQYQQVLLSAFPTSTTWRSLVEEELTPLGNLPGILGALLFRLDHDDVFTIEASAGPYAAEISTILRDPTSQTVLDPHSPRGNGAVARSWRNRQIEQVPSYMTDTGYQFWWNQVASLGLRSSLAVPIMDEENLPVAVIALYGHYLNQFGSTKMLQFAHHLQHRWKSLWWTTSHLAPKQAVSQDLSHHYRKRLFSGGLTMYVQPLIDLASGKLEKVEALARLQLSTGEVLSPAAFLPLLEEEEYHLLFQQGLDQTLASMKEWEKQGIFVSLSINASPSTLLHPHFADWVKESLDKFQVQPNRLSLEVLENESYDQDAFYSAIQPLNRMGVTLSMDDLGSGYSSLERLSSRCFDLIKIDQGLLFRIRQDPLSILSLIDMIVQLGDNLGLDVVVEGLESQDVLEAVMMLNAKLGQGYGIAKPMPLHELPLWLRSFEVPAQHGEIHTFLGALAFHWKSMRKRRSQVQLAADRCPLTHFLKEKGLMDSEPARWHQMIHDGHDSRIMSQKLTNWLVEQVQAEHGDLQSTESTRGSCTTDS